MSTTTVRGYLDLLTGLFLVLHLQPFGVNIGKRLVKAPKIYLTDSGILHNLLGFKTSKALATYPKIGASWEGFVMQAILRILQVWPEDAFYWRPHNGAELDLLVLLNEKN